MKKLLLFTFLLMGSLIVFAQDSDKVASLIQEGVKCYDTGDYEGAVNKYKEALSISPGSYDANYELGMTYMHVRDYENALEYTEKAIEVGDENSVQAYMNKGSILNYMGKTAESLKAFELAEEKFGEYYLLYFNWGLVYFHTKEYSKAAELFEKGVSENFKHGSGHLYLGFSQANMDKKIPALLSLYFFLALEPGTQRSVNAISLVYNLFEGNVEQVSKKEITITLNSMDENSEFVSAELILPMIVAASKGEDNKDKSKTQLFAENTESLFRSLKETSGDRSSDEEFSLWWDFYVQYLVDMLDAGQMQTFCYYINASTDADARNWLHKNAEKLDELKVWMNGYFEK